MFVEKLRQFGLDEKETLVYLALLSLGPSPVRTVAAKSGVNRGTTYDILKKLREQGLATTFDKQGRDGKKQHFSAEPPEKILTAIEKKVSDLSHLKDSIKDSLPELDAIYERAGAKPVSKYYEGVNGLRMVLSDVIQQSSKLISKQYYVYSAADIRELLYKAYPAFNKDRLKAKVSVQVIALGKGGELAGLDERKWMKSDSSAPAYIILYAGKTAMISVAPSREPVAVVIEDKALYETQRMIFEYNWERIDSKG